MRIATVMLLGVGALVAFCLATSGASTPAPPRPPGPLPSVEAGPRGPETPASIATAVAGPAEAATASPLAQATDPFGAELETLIKELRAGRTDGRSPEGTLDAIGALLRGHPGLIRALLELIPGEDRNFRSLLVHAVMRSGNRRLVATLNAAIAAEADDGERRVKSLLASTPDRIAVAIANLEDAGDRMDLVRGISRSQMRDPGVLAALRLASETDPDPHVRRSSLFRLGRSGDIRGRASAIEVLEDPVADENDRAAAALALGGLRSEDDPSVFVEILRRGGESARIEVLLVNGLSQVVGRTDVDEILFDRLQSAEADLDVRKVAAATLALGGQRLRGTARAELEERAIGALQTLDGQAGSETVYAWSRSQFADSFGPGFRSRLQPAADSQSSLRSPED